MTNETWRERARTSATVESRRAERANPIAAELKRQEGDQVAPFAIQTASDECFEFGDGLADGQFARDHEDSGDWLAVPETVIGVTGHGISVMCDDDAALLGGPGEEVRIRRAVKSGLQCGERVKLRQTQAQAPQNIVIEILIYQEPEHQDAFRSRSAARALMRSPHFADAALLRRILRDELLQFISGLKLTGQILIEFCLVIEVVREAGMNIGQTQRRKLQRDFFRRRALPVMVQDRIQTDARFGNTDRAIRRE